MLSIEGTTKYEQKSRHQNITFPQLRWRTVKMKLILQGDHIHKLDTLKYGNFE